MSRIMLLIPSPTGAIWLIGPTKPTVAATAEMASSNGSPAATSAPKAIRRMARVRGSDVYSACLKSSPTLSSSALARLASPYCSIFSSGWALAAAATEDSASSTSSAVFLESPGISKFTSAELPPGETPAPALE
jgi:hypothetical protein